MSDIKKPSERDSHDLLELVCQLHGRALANPFSEEMHNAYVEAREELEDRFSSQISYNAAIQDTLSIIQKYNTGKEFSPLFNQLIPKIKSLIKHS